MNKKRGGCTNGKKKKKGGEIGNGDENGNGPPNIEVTSPNGGENWKAGSFHDITWKSTGPITNVDIEYSTDGGNSWTTIASSAPNNWIYPWRVPNTLSSNCLVRVSDVNGLASDTSDNVFTIY